MAITTQRCRFKELPIRLSIHNPCGSSTWQLLCRCGFLLDGSRQARDRRVAGSPCLPLAGRELPLLDQRLSSLPAVSRQSTQYVASFEMLALNVAAGYGVGICTQSRIERAHGWGLIMRSLVDGPYEVVTYLQRPYVQATPATERFERRALQVAATI